MNNPEQFEKLAQLISWQKGIDSMNVADLRKLIDSVWNLFNELRPTPTIMKKEEKKSFEDELKFLINKHSMDSESNTPDFVLTKHLIECLKLYNETIKAKNKFQTPSEL